MNKLKLGIYKHFIDPCMCHWCFNQEKESTNKIKKGKYYYHKECLTETKVKHIQYIITLEVLNYFFDNYHWTYSAMRSLYNHLNEEFHTYKLTVRDNNLYVYIVTNDYAHLMKLPLNYDGFVGFESIPLKHDLDTMIEMIKGQ